MHPDERDPYSSTRNWLALVGAFGWLAFTFGGLSIAAIWVLHNEGRLILVDPVEASIYTFLASLFTGAVLIALSRVGNAVCDIAVNTRPKRSGGIPGTARQEPVLRAPQPRDG
ncbi:hypothetical protein HKCCE2091_20280 [Rhodobacterales bacterium HKCCE2091]|nr:hypothetical protein [Rhodobacterales bacterium HKCCE2091]